MAGSLSDISKLTGLGITTVSEILRDKPGYREETRRIVHAAARELGYRPNLMARGLKRGRSQTIGVVIGSLSTPITMAKLSEIELSARQSGYTTFVTRDSFSAPKDSLHLLDQLLSRQVDGLIVMLPISPSDAVLDRLQDATIPVVFVEWAPPQASWQLVFSKQAALRDAAEHLVGLGHRKGLFLSTPSDWRYPQLKFQDWQQAGEHCGIAVRMDADFLLEPSSHFEDQTYEMIRRRAAKGRLPGLLLMNNDACAIAALAALTDAGLEVPRDISLVGYDDTVESRFCRPALSTIHQPRTEIGHQAFAMLLEAMTHKASGRTHSVDFRFIQRASTGPAPRGDRFEN